MYEGGGGVGGWRGGGVGVGLLNRERTYNDVAKRDVPQTSCTWINIHERYFD